MCPKDVDKMANSVVPDQTAPEVRSGSTLFAWTCLSEKLESLGCIYTIWAENNKGADQTVLMHMLICIFVVCI